MLNDQKPPPGLPVFPAPALGFAGGRALLLCLKYYLPKLRTVSSLVRKGVWGSDRAMGTPLWRVSTGIHPDSSHLNLPESKVSFLARRLSWEGLELQFPESQYASARLVKISVLLLLAPEPEHVFCW